MLFIPSQSPYDLSFSLFGTAVRIHVSFWIVAAILGWSWVEVFGVGYLLLWIVCVMLSILLHEFGHVWAGKLFGADGDILLYSFGGMALGASDVRWRWQRVIVYLAGPAIQFVLFGLLLLLEWYVLPRPPAGGGASVGRIMLGMLLAINLFWPLFNLLPILPLDGGRVTNELCEAVWPRDGHRYALIISIAGCALIVVNSILAMNHQAHVPYLAGGLYTIVLFAMIGIQSFTELQQLSGGPRSPWDE